MKLLLTYLLSVVSVVYYGQNSGEITYQELSSSNVLQFINTQKNTEVTSANVNIQIGNENAIFVSDKSSKSLQIIQQGNFNTTNYVNPNTQPTDLEIKSLGDNNYIDVTGNNSNSEGMKVSIKGNDKMIFVRNY